MSLAERNRQAAIRKRTEKAAASKLRQRRKKISKFQRFRRRYLRCGARGLRDMDVPISEEAVQACEAIYRARSALGRPRATLPRPSPCSPRPLTRRAVTPRDIARIKSAFDAVDIDGSGEIDRMEMFEYLEEVRSPFSEGVFQLAGATLACAAPEMLGGGVTLHAPLRRRRGDEKGADSLQRLPPHCRPLLHVFEGGDSAMCAPAGAADGARDTCPHHPVLGAQSLSTCSISTTRAHWTRTSSSSSRTWSTARWGRTSPSVSPAPVTRGPSRRPASHVHPPQNPTFPGNFARALEEFDTNDDGQLDFDEFRVANRRFPMMLFPAFRLQDNFRKKTLGEPRPPPSEARRVLPEPRTFTTLTHHTGRTRGGQATMVGIGSCARSPARRRW